MCYLVDFLLFLVILASVVNGYRRGVIVDVIQFIIWLPICGISIFVALGHIQSDSFSGSNLELLQSVALLMVSSYFMLWLINKYVLTQIFHATHLQSIHLLGIASGFYRITITIVAAILLFNNYSYDKELPENIAESYIVQHGQKLSLMVEDFAREQGWINQEIIIYDYEQDAENIKRERIRKLMGR